MFENWKIRKADLANEELAEKLQNEQSEVAHWCNENQQYRINDNAEYIFVEPIPEPTEEEKAEMEIAQLKRYLSDTDYIVFKIAEGSATAEDYTDVIRKRQEARARINKLEVGK